jgi:hypothetical protein
MSEHRRSFRYPEHMAEREATLFVQGARIEAAVVDVSGVGVIVADPKPLRIGLELEFQELDPGSPKRRVKVTHIAPTDFSLIRIGLQWA